MRWSRLRRVPVKVLLQYKYSDILPDLQQYKHPFPTIKTVLSVPVWTQRLAQQYNDQFQPTSMTTLAHGDP